jgi:hypothetical protein
MMALFFALLFDYRRPQRRGHLDLLLLTVGLSASLVVYFLGDLGWSVFSASAVIALLALRMLAVSARKSGEAILNPSLPSAALLAVIAVLLPGRILLSFISNKISGWRRGPEAFGFTDPEMGIVLLFASNYQPRLAAQDPKASIR